MKWYSTFCRIMVGPILIVTSVNTHAGMQSNITKKLSALENISGGRIGLSVINTENSNSVRYHAKQRFAFCSTYKLMLVADVLQRSIEDKGLLQRKLYYKKSELMAYSPITTKHQKRGMTVKQLCAAAMLSDNTAANLLLKNISGPQALNKFARAIGDKAFRLDRTEPTLNSAIPGDIRDTTTPTAMAKSMDKLVLGKVLPPPQRKQLQRWLKQNTTGDSRIRASVAHNWVVGDKTGTGDYGTTNDIGIIWPPKHKPIVMVIYFTQSNKDAAPKNAVIASVTRIVLKALDGI